jgi:hypothetical protein
MFDAMTYRGAALLFLIATPLSAQVTGACSVHKQTEIQCVIQNQKRGILVDIRPRVPHVRAQIDAYQGLCGATILHFSETFTFSQQPGNREVWYRYNGGFAPVEGKLPVYNCFWVYIIKCHEATAGGLKPQRPCGELLDANGFTFEDRSE